MSDEYRIVNRLPTLDEYRAMLSALGWDVTMNLDAAEAALAHSLLGVVALYQGEVVGMGRVVGDGAIFFYIQDFAVLPQHQRKGIGSRLLEALLAQIRASAPPQSFIGLFATGEACALYRRYGFETRAGLVGMFQTV